MPPTFKCCYLICGRKGAILCLVFLYPPFLLSPHFPFLVAFSFFSSAPLTSYTPLLFRSRIFFTFRPPYIFGRKNNKFIRGHQGKKSMYIMNKRDTIKPSLFLFFSHTPKTFSFVPNLSSIHLLSQPHNLSPSNYAFHNDVLDDPCLVGLHPLLPSSGPRQSHFYSSCCPGTSW